MFPKIKILTFYIPCSPQWLSCQSICLTGRLWVRSPTKDTKTCQLHCTPVSISNAGYSGLSPNCIPEYLSATKYTKTSVSCTVGYPEYQSGTQGIVACYMKCTPEYQSATKYMKSCQLHCTLMYQSVTWDIHLECIDILEYRSATIKVYEDLSATLVPGVSVSNPGYNSLSPRMFCSIGSRSILCRWLIFTGLHFRWQVPIHWLIDWYTREQCSLQVFIYTLLLTDIPVYIPCDRPLYSRLQTYILGNSVADRYSYTLSLTGIRVCTSGDMRLNLGTV